MTEMGFCFSSSQCNDKWRYLKAKYTARKDNMGAKGTGQEPTDIEYFEEMDSFLGKKHTIVPIAVASSPKGATDAAKKNFPDNEKNDNIECG
ncbi:unnamed protein product [Brassicogethes aeneus]|uniref:Myb/SANT-like DNA-binding domain-containing protein n=1 Tax=Brassicogethes aeneus TaxID=1431903 RepID=A0A9P0FMG1_BRAAE|nr:unnamed protein product [Brassicogethes aeneus]